MVMTTLLDMQPRDKWSVYSLLAGENLHSPLSELTQILIEMIRFSFRRKKEVMWALAYGLCFLVCTIKQLAKSHVIHMYLVVGVL
ncbi:hypothetical protein GOP47_0015244 [Adiantum capillus-veneris]|uniref:Uncharacterized protein n=1 Tax=Adiantum capillus-veneris TaxID=13818 RepID=A0A9D4UK92_ADICA|nr:hypothetical protein GOP47_0015244 [Adiantum capillus-veneris]